MSARAIGPARRAGNRERSGEVAPPHAGRGSDRTCAAVAGEGRPATRPEQDDVVGVVLDALNLHPRCADGHSGYRESPGLGSLGKEARERFQEHFSIVVSHDTKSVEAYDLTASDGASPGRRKVGGDLPPVLSDRCGSWR